MTSQASARERTKLISDSASRWRSVALGSRHANAVCSLVVAFALVAWLIPNAARGEDSQPKGPSERVGLLTLINGNTIAGSLCPNDSGDILCWQGSDFVDPFRVRVAATRSIKFPSRVPPEDTRGEFAFEFSNGDVIAGSLSRWDSGSIEIDSSQFGTLLVEADSVQRLHRLEQNPTLVFASLSGLQDWNDTQWDTTEWQEEGDHLSTTTSGAALNGDLQVPDRAVVEFELSWSGRPDFVFAIAVDSDREVDQSTDGWRFETVDGNLAVVREHEDVADMAMVADLTDLQRIRLTAYLDQRTGEMRVLLPDGTTVARLSLSNDAEEVKGSGSGIRLINRGRNLRLERLRIARWLGMVPSKSDDNEAEIALNDGTSVSGAIQRLDRQAGTLIIGEQESAVDVAKVVAVKLGHSRPQADSAQCAVFLHGGMRLSGNLSAIDTKSWVLTGPNFQRPVMIPRNRVRSMVVFRQDTQDQLKIGSIGRRGRLELASNHLDGWLVSIPESAAQENADENADENAQGILRWHALASENAATLKTGSQGRIVYRDPPKIDTTTASARSLAMQRLRLQQQKRGLNFGELFLKRVDNDKAQPVRHDAHVLHVRAGDVISCRVISIDAEGVRISTADSGEGFVSHDRVKAIELVSNSPPPDLVEAKRERLLTIPRLQKSLPPSHLLCSRNGDYLRCRLLSADDQVLRVEVQMEEIEIPRERVAQIIWFHPKQANTEDSVDTDEAELAESVVVDFSLLAQVLRRDGKRITFTPTGASDKTISGNSDILGDVHFELREVDQIILGEQIQSEVAQLAYNRWKLQPAVEPLVSMESGDGPVLGADSPLIGQVAPEIKLGLLDGGQFRLSEQKGKIIVLDFWATWCAPCMLSMPLLEEAIAEFDERRVQLISVNLEESADHVRDVLERNKMNLTVVMDIDGVAAQRYQARAIPQLVIVDAEGTVSRLYVGGGSAVVDKMKADLLDLLGEGGDSL